jgi:uncharacterized tellurite resistance protein B-like protein
MPMVDAEPPDMPVRPRDLIARLAAAVMVADGHITATEVYAAEQLRELGLGPLGDVVDAELLRAMHVPIDVRSTAEALAHLAPHVGLVVVSALTQVAASDAELSQREIDVLALIADGLNVSRLDVTQMIRTAARAYGAARADTDVRRPTQRPSRMRASTTTAPRPGARTFTGLRSSSRSSGMTSTSAETRRITSAKAATSPAGEPR